MSWICAKCETENPDDLDLCEVCGGKRTKIDVVTPNSPVLPEIPPHHNPPPLPDPLPPSRPNGCLITLLVITCIGILFMIFKCSVPSNNEIRNVNNARMEITLGKCYYTGPIDKTDLPHGRGKAEFDDGRIYSGDFKHGVAEGENSYFKSKDGNIFQGTFKDNRYVLGKYTNKGSGMYYYGTFEKGKPYNGTLYSSNGETIGIYKYGVYE